MAQQFTVRQLVNQSSMEIGIIQQPVNQIFSSRDQDVVQMASLLNAVADELLLEEPYKYTLGDGVWVEDSNGDPKLFPTQDEDRILFDARLAINGIKYRFLQAKGLEFAEQLRDYTVRLNKLAASVNAKVLDLDFDVGRVQ
jgi:hypothetical protein